MVTIEVQYFPLFDNPLLNGLNFIQYSPSYILLITTLFTMVINILLHAIAGTYRRKAKRDLQAATSASGSLSSLDVLKAQEMILKEMGPDACVYEKVCSAYAEAAALAKKDRHNGKAGVDRMDWEKIIRYVMHVINALLPKVTKNTSNTSINKTIK